MDTSFQLLVTAVIPTRGRPELVQQAVRSALSQTWQALEVVVVVDGPDPVTIAALDSLGERRVRVIALEESVGGCEARNIGVNHAKGKWIALLDDDDEWLPEKIEMQMAAVAGRGHRSILIASMYYHRTAGFEDVVRPRRLPREGESIVNFMFDYLCYFQTSTMVCSIDVIRRIPFEKGLSLFQDIDWFLRVNQSPDVEFVSVPVPLSIYNEPAQRNSITSTTAWRARLEWGRARRAMLTRRAYSSFVVGSCAVRAMQDGAGISGLARLLYEAAIVGSPTPRLLAILMGAYLLPAGARKKIRDLLFLKRRGAWEMVHGESMPMRPH